MEGLKISDLPNSNDGKESVDKNEEIIAEKVRFTRSISELKDLIAELGSIKTSREEVDSEKYNKVIDGVVDGKYPIDVITRKYGIRDQIVFIKVMHGNKEIHNGTRCLIERPGV